MGTGGGFDSENLYIEGDNLEVLKLLQETYLGKVKLIYIDPPYNTGNDYVYEDDFSESNDRYQAYNAQSDELGARLMQNTESNGRFHTNWLNMMYPRLKLAKNLLSEEGVIFISIDARESANLRKVCDELFGAACFVCEAIWRSSDNSNNDAKQFSNDYNSTLIYSRMTGWQPRKQEDPEKRKHFKNPDNDPRGPYFDGNPLNSPNYRENLVYDIISPSGKVIHPPKNGWRWSKQTLEEKIRTGEIRFNEEETNIKRRTYLCDMEGLPPSNLWIDLDKTGHNRQAKYELLSLIPEDVFDTPKPVKLILYILGLIKESEDAIVMDYFSGSATTAHAIMQLNAEDGGHRKFIMVQLPEICEENTEAYKAGYKNICEIGKERIRRAARKIREAAGLTLPVDFDGGFRCLRLDSSNMQDVYYNPAATSQDLLGFTTDNIKPDRTPEDLLFQVMLELGVALSSPIAESTVTGKKVFDVADGYLLACFDEGVNTETVTAIAKKEPYYAVFRDSSMADDSTATNFDQIFQTYSPTTVRKVL